MNLNRRKTLLRAPSRSGSCETEDLLGERDRCKNILLPALLFFAIATIAGPLAAQVTPPPPNNLPASQSP